MMRVCLLSLLLCQAPCSTLGYGLILLSLLTGKQAEEGAVTSPEVPPSDHLYETRVAKNIDIEEDEERGLLDTLNLSLAGNLDISNAVSEVSIDGLPSNLRI